MSFKKGYGWNKGKTGIYTKETISRISNSLKKAYKEGRIKIKSGENHPRWNKHHTKESKKKISESLKGKNKNKPKSEEHKKHMSEARMGKNPWNKGLKCPQLSGENNGNWKNGSSFLPYCNRFSFRIKEEIRNKYERKCFICEKNEKDNILKGKICRLEVHHVDYDKTQGCNEKKWNLIPLCKSCHSIISGKHKREYYKELIVFLLKLYEIKLTMKNWIMGRSLQNP